VHRNQFFIQDSLAGNDVYFHDAAAENGIDFDFNGYSNIGDFDHDGDLDIYISPNDGPGYLYRNTTAVTGDYLLVEALGANGERDCWHARVELYDQGTHHLRAWSELNTSNVNRSGFQNYFATDGDDHYDIRIAFANGVEMGPEEYPQLSNVVPTTIGHYLTVHMGQQQMAAKPVVSVPQAFVLSPAYPNPFNPSTTLSFTLPVAANVTLAVYDVQGKRVADLMQGALTAGEHRATWNAGSQASGIYFVELAAGTQTARQKIVLLK
jgi:hypothetical protein